MPGDVRSKGGAIHVALASIDMKYLAIQAFGWILYCSGSVSLAQDFTPGASAMGRGRPSAVPVVSFALELVARSGDEPPGRPGESFTVFADPTVGAGGSIAFRGDFDGPLSGNQGIYLASRGSGLQRVVDDSFDFSPPGQSGASSWTSFGPPVLDGLDRLVFWGGFSFGDNSQGVYAFDGALGEVIFDDNPLQSIPGHPAGNGFTTFPFSAATRPTGGGGKRGVSGATFLDVGFVSQQGLYVGAPTSGIAGVADTTISPPGQPGAARFTAFGSGLASNAGGDVVFRGTFSGGVGSQGIYRYIHASSSLVCVADASLSVPGQAGSASFTSFDGLISTNNAGVVAFQATYASGSGNNGVYLGDGLGALTRIADNSGAIAVPGQPSAAFSAFGSASVNRAGDVLFSATVSGGTSGIFLASGGNLQSVLNFADPVPGQPGATFFAVGYSTLNGRGHVAVNARYSGGSGDEGLYFFDGGGLFRVVDESDTSLGLSITNLHANVFTGPSGGQDGRPEFLGNDDTLSVRASLLGGDQAILRATLE